MQTQHLSPRNYIAHIVEEILTTDGTARVVAFSFAFGSFLALLPTFGFGVFIGMLFLLLFPKLHKPMLLLAFFVWNPLVLIPIYSLSIFVGSLIFSGMPIVSFDFALLDHVYNVTRRVLVGSLIVSTTLSLLSYIVVFVTIRKLKHRPIFKK